MAIPSVSITAPIPTVNEGDTSPTIPVPNTDAGLFRLGLQKFGVFVDFATNAWAAVTQFGSSAASTTTAPANSYAAGKQHLVMVGQSTRTPAIYRNGIGIAGGGTGGGTGSLVIQSTDEAIFGSTDTLPLALVGKYGRAVLWSYAPSPGQIAISYAIQSKPLACIGRSTEVTAGTANRPPVAVPMAGTQPEQANADYDVVQRAYDPESDTLTLSVPSQPAGGVASVVAGQLRFRPDAGQQGNLIDVTAQVTDDAARISQTIVSVDVTAPVVIGPPGFDQSLPMGGTGVGLVSFLGGPGNMRNVFDFCIIQIRCEHTGNLRGLCWNSRFDALSGNLGYHAQGTNGGTINWTVRRITSPYGQTPLQLGPVLGTTANVPRPAGDQANIIRGPETNPGVPPGWPGPWTAWDPHFHAAGGSGATTERFARFPVINFTATNGVPVTAGDWLGFTMNQLASDGSTYISPNHSFSNHRIQGDLSPYSYGERRQYTPQSLSQFRTDFYPIFTYYYTDGFCCGNVHMDYAAGTQPLSQLLTGAGVRHREVIPMPAWANGKVVARVYMQGVRWDNTTAADLTMRIARADGFPEGVTLATRTLSASSIFYLASRDLKDQSANQLLPINQLAYLIFAFGNVTVVGGQTYYFEATTGSNTGTRYLTGRPDRTTKAVGDVGVREPSYLFTGMKGQENSGTGWIDLVSGAGNPETPGTRIHDIPLWAEFA